MEDKFLEDSLKEDISKEITEFLVGVLRSSPEDGKIDAAIKNKMKACEMLEKRLNILYDDEETVIIVDDIPDKDIASDEQDN